MFELNVKKILSIFILTGDPLVGSIAKQFLTQRSEHDRTAVLWTKRYAK